MENRHYYRFDILSELGKQFNLFWKSCDDAERAADTWAAKAGAKSFYTSPTAFAGGVACVSFEETPNEKIWEPLGKDADGVEQWKPRCSNRSGVVVLPRRNFMPSDTSSRIYSKRIITWGEAVMHKTLQEWAQVAGVQLTGDKRKDKAVVSDKLKDEFFMQYIDLYREDFVPGKVGAKQKLMSHVQKTAINLERTRMLLPTVSVKTLYRLLDADLTVGLKEGKSRVVRDDETPTFFKTGRRYYICINHACRHHNLEEADAAEYRMKAEEAIGKEKGKGKKKD